MARNKGPVSFRLSEDGRELLAAVATHLGVSKASAVEVMIRDYVRTKMGLKVEPAPSRLPGRPKKGPNK